VGLHARNQEKHSEEILYAMERPFQNYQDDQPNTCTNINRLKKYLGRERFDKEEEIEFKAATPRNVVYESARLALIGRRVAVKYYPRDDKYYPGTVVKYNDQDTKHEILFDDYLKDTILDTDDENYQPPKRATRGKWRNIWPSKEEIARLEAEQQTSDEANQKDNEENQMSDEANVEAEIQAEQVKDGDKVNKESLSKKD